MKFKKILFAFVLFPVLFTHAQANDTARLDIVDTAVQAGNFKTLVSLVERADLVNTLKGLGPFTVFAPTDEAFAKLPKELVQKLLHDKALLKTVLTYHVVAGQVLAKDAVAIAARATLGTPVQTVLGKPVFLNLRGPKAELFVNRSQVIAPNVLTTNGVIHVIDSVLLPPQ